MTLAVDLWFWPLDRPGPVTDALAAHLDDTEMRRATSFLKPGDGDRFRVGRGRMREILASYTGAAPSALAFDHVGRNKPILTGGPAFNLSHAGGWAAMAVAPNSPNLQIGIDIEASRPVELSLARRVLSPDELADLATLTQADWMAGFLNAWTRKEAMIKATGAGFGVDLRGFGVTLLPDAPARVRDAGTELPPAGDWDLQALDTGAHLRGALAAVTGGAALGPLTLREGTLPLPAPTPTA